MTVAAYDILKKDATALVWIEAVQDLETARLRVMELIARSEGEYVIFDQRTRARFERLGELIIHEGAGRMPAEQVERYLPEMALLIGQTDMPKERLDRATNLRASSRWFANARHSAAMAKM